MTVEFLSPKSRSEPRYKATLADVLEAIEFAPYRSAFGGKGPGWLFLSTYRSGRSYPGGCHHVKFKPALIDMLAPSIFSNSAEHLHEELSMELISQQDGSLRLYMQFQSITGSYCLMEVSEAEAIEWLDRHKEAA